jgi:hypothetical protein
LILYQLLVVAQRHRWPRTAQNLLLMDPEMIVNEVFVALDGRHSRDELLLLAAKTPQVRGLRADDIPDARTPPPQGFNYNKAQDRAVPFHPCFLISYGLQGMGIDYAINAAHAVLKMINN